MRQLLACSLVLLFFVNAANAASVTWLSDSRILHVLNVSEGEELASPDFGTTTWDASVSAGSAYASQNTTIGTTSVFGGTGEMYMDGIADWHSILVFGATFRVAGGGTTLDLSGDYSAYGEYGLPGPAVVFQLKQGDTVIYQASGDVINYSGFLADGDYQINVNAGVGHPNSGGADFDFTGEFGTSEVAFVPIPAAVWLFGSGLGFLGWMRRRQAD